MADRAATDVSGRAGAALTEFTGASSGDTVPAGSLCIWRNTGAGSHTVTITTNNTSDGLPIDDQVYTIPASGVWAGRIKSEWGDANGRCAVAINGTATEVKYYVQA